MKFCKKCNTLKSIADFHKRSGAHDGLQAHCKVCRNIAASSFYSSNRQKCDAAIAMSRAANPDKRKATKLAWCYDNPDKIKIYNTKWCDKNSDKVSEYRRNNSNKRRAKKKGSGGLLSIGLFGKLFALQKGKCPVCKSNLSNTNPRSPMDHIMPIALGGANADENIQLLCKPCNSKKHAKHPIDFMQSKGFLL